MGASFQILSEQDYIDLIGVIHKLQECETQRDLERAIQDHVCSLFQVQAFSSAWLEDDQINPTKHKNKPISTVGLTEDEIRLTPAIQPCFTELTKSYARGLRTVLACDIDLPRETLLQELDLFFSKNPEYDRNQYPLYKNITNHLSMVDAPDCSIIIGLSRLSPNEAPFTHRELRMAELLQPSLVHAIKYIALRRDLTNFTALAEHLADVPAPIVLVRPEGRIMFCNDAFEKTFRLQRGDRLPEDLSRTVQDHDDVFTPSENFSGMECPSHFYKANKLVYRLSLTRLDPMEDYEGRCWLFKFKPALDPYSEAVYAMHRARFTARETEVAALVCDGFSDKEIAERLFISPNTVNNHLKHIFKKMDVHSRIQLIHRLQGFMKGGSAQ